MVTALAICLLGTARKSAAPFLSPVFGDHMVLQRDRPNTFWGWTEPGDEVKILVAGKRFASRAGADGKWLVRFNPPPVGGPYEMVVQGQERLELHDVMVGDVYLCTGQSNMEMGVANVQDGEKEIAEANHPRIRLYEVPRAIEATPKPYAEGTWRVCTPEGIRHGVWGGFSAVGYFFGRELERRLNVPIGLVQSCWGGTVAEAWTSREGLVRMPDFRDAFTARESDEQRFESWLRKNDPGSQPGKSLDRIDAADADWRTVGLPAHYSDLGIGDFVGVVWYRMTVEVDHAHAGKSARLVLGSVSDCDRTWVNGQTVGATFEWSANREYEIPAGMLKEGSNVVAVRCLDTGYWGGLNADPGKQYLEFQGGDRLGLPATWKYRATMDLRGRAGLPIGLFNAANRPSALYNGMIAPLFPMAFKGVIWYQGESNTDRAYQYRALLPNLIADWRRQARLGDFPFLIVQIANFLGRAEQPSDNSWAELREAQAMTADRVPHTGLAVTIDIGMWNDIHPVNKQEVGRRLALSALNVVYHDREVVASGPRFAEFKVEKDRMRLRFRYAEGGLKMLEGTSRSFALAGSDRKFYWATPEVVGSEIVLHCPQVARPVAARYAWAGNPEAPLYNGAGLPAVPFRTDTWPGVTYPKPPLAD